MIHPHGPCSALRASGTIADGGPATSPQRPGQLLALDVRPLVHLAQASFSGGYYHNRMSSLAPSRQSLELGCIASDEGLFLSAGPALHSGFAPDGPPGRRRVPRLMGRSYPTRFGDKRALLPRPVCPASPETLQLASYMSRPRPVEDNTCTMFQEPHVLCARNPRNPQEPRNPQGGGSRFHKKSDEGMAFRFRIDATSWESRYGSLPPFSCPTLIPWDIISRLFQRRPCLVQWIEKPHNLD